MVKIPSLFGKNMVIEPKAKVWGFAAPNETVPITFAGKPFSAVADAAGRFEAVIDAGEVGDKGRLTIGEHVIEDVCVGHVWICGGQSNMETLMSRVAPLLSGDFKQDDMIRLYQVPKELDFDAPRTDADAAWRTATGDLSELFAVPYFFARALRRRFNAPIGLVCAAAGGASAQSWLPEDILRRFPKHLLQLAEVRKPGYVAETEAADIARMIAWNEELASRDAGLAEGWHGADYDDSSWAERFITDRTGLPATGAAWFRKTVELTQGGAGTLTLGRAMNNVVVYVNGQKVGEVTYQFPPCVCEIPDGVLKAGRNVIAARVVGESVPLCFVPCKPYRLVYGGGTVELGGRWRCRVGARAEKPAPASTFYRYPLGRYNAMFAPIAGYSARGVIWYQGETNASDPEDYNDLMTAFLRDVVRKRWHGDMPFIFTQLANFDEPDYSCRGNWAAVREEQAKLLAEPRTAMAVAMDCGEWNDLHPLDKRTVAERLALCARKLAYGDDVEHSGAVAESAAVEGDSLVIRFSHAKGLRAEGPVMFDIYAPNGAANAVEGRVNGETVVVPLNGRPIAEIRYCYRDSPVASLYNAADLPTPPFRFRID